MKRIAVFARWPEPGRVKTRLSPALPHDLACRLFGAMLEDASIAAAGSDADQRLLYWADAPAEGSATPPGGAALEVRRQNGGDLGERLARAFDELLPGPGDRAVVIGADCPDLDAAFIEAAFRALESYDLAIAPARDGGYALIGLRRPASELFRGIDWGAATVLERTLDRARELGLTVFRLGALDDLDTPEDLVRWIRRRMREHAADSHTAAALRSMGLLPPASPDAATASRS
jgi:rSAM/selenodomain-associated transferase 1